MREFYRSRLINPNLIYLRGSQLAFDKLLNRVGIDLHVDPTSVCPGSRIVFFDCPRSFTQLHAFEVSCFVVLNLRFFASGIPASRSPFS